MKIRFLVRPDGVVTKGIRVDIDCTSKEMTFADVRTAALVKLDLPELDAGTRWAAWADDDAIEIDDAEKISGLDLSADSQILLQAVREVGAPAPLAALAGKG